MTPARRRPSPSCGTATVFGVDILADPIRARRLIGYLPGDLRLFGGPSAVSNLRFFGKPSGLARPGQRIREPLLFLQCGELGEKPIDTMSKGQRQRIGLAQAILHRLTALFPVESASGPGGPGIKTLCHSQAMRRPGATSNAAC